MKRSQCIGALLLMAAVVGRQPSARALQDPCEYQALTLDKTKAFLPADKLGVFDLKDYIQRCGVTFILDEKGAAELRQMGAKPEVVSLLAPPSSPADNASWTPLTDRREMNWIASGAFTMGSPPDETGRKEDEVESRVTIAGFWLDRTEVTNEAYRKFVMAQPERWAKGRVPGAEGYLKTWTDNEFPAGQGKLPVVNVTWNSASAYAEWAGKRLPTEAEWEYAARAGRTSAYWWGSVFQSDKANAADEPLAVGQESTKNPWGLFDMLGNVWEWTSCAYAGSGDRVVRGGSFGGSGAFLRAAKRHHVDPKRAVLNVGFRCALPVGARGSTDR